MPLYDYGCPKCGSEFESLQKMNVEELPCETAGCESVAKRLVSRPRHLDKLGVEANLSSVRFNFNWVG